MIYLQSLTDRAAIGLSALCTLHCLALPLALVLIPSLGALNLNNESVHTWMIFAVVPTSAYALTMGCRQHKRYALLALGGLGLACLISALVLVETLLHHSPYAEFVEKSLTTVGSLFIAIGHVYNFRLCRHKQNCACSEHDTSTEK